MTKTKYNTKKPPKLQIWGKSQLEAAQRPKSDRKYNVGVVASVKISGGSTTP